MAKEKEYVRLSGRRYFTLGFTRNSLWLGTDHLLHVINRGYTEEYRRFYYRDIQAILLRRTSVSKVINSMLGVLAAIHTSALLYGLLIGAWEAIATVPLAVACAFWILAFVIQVASGPTCICHLRTAVQFEPLPSLFRIRTARKAIAQIRHRVESVQRTIVPEPPST